MRTLGWIAGIIILLMVIASLVASLYLPSMLRDRIQRVVVSGSDSLYTCEIGDVSVNLWKRRVTVRNVVIRADTNRYNKMKAAGNLPLMTFDISLSKGSIGGFAILPFVFGRRIKLSNITAEEAGIDLFRHYERPAPRTPRAPLWKMIRPSIRGIHIGEIVLNKIRFSYRHSDEKRTMRFRYEDCSARLEKIDIDSTGFSDPARVLYTRDIIVRFRNISSYVADSMYELKAGEVEYSSFSKIATAKDFSLLPAAHPSEFTRRNGQQIDVYHVQVPMLRATNFQLTSLFANNLMAADTMFTTKPSLLIYRDRTAPPDTVTKYGRYPNEALMGAPFTLRVPVLVLTTASVAYKEKQARSGVEGLLAFTDIDGTIKNITNDSSDLQKNGHCVIDLEGLFLGEGKMKAIFDFDLASEDGSYAASADLGEVSGSSMNKITVPFANLRLNSVRLHNAKFTLRGNRDGTSGTLEMVYNDLNVELLKVKDSSPAKEQKFLSFLANAVAIRKNNPADGHTAQNVVVIRTRVQPFFNLIWRTILGGMKEIMLKGAAKKIKLGNE